MDQKEKQIVDSVVQLLGEQLPAQKRVITDISRLAGDGSSRIFLRLSFADTSSIVAVLPGGDAAMGKKEAASAWQICLHLRAAGTAVPKPLAYDRQTGLILFEDLGDTRLHDLLQTDEYQQDHCRFNVYREVIRELVCLQVRGRENFDVSWCWQTPLYDRQLMLERESGYFLQALCRDFLNLRPDADALSREFERIADTAAKARSGFFLHRDFQSRNIMIREGRVRIIDFQGGRLGPLGYDLASLLLDPYAGLSPELRESLLEEYLGELLRRVPYDAQVFKNEYVYLAMQRNLQILGAFAFLGGQKGKTFFLPYIQPALKSMRNLLDEAGRGQFPALAGLTGQCREEIGKRGL